MPKKVYDSVPIESVYLDPSNARLHPEANLKAIKGSLLKFKQQKPILITRDNIVIAGNGTLMAAKELGWTTIDVRYTDLSGPEAIAYALADNRTSELAEWDKNILGKQLQSLYEDGFGIADIGFEPIDFFPDEKKSEYTLNEVIENDSDENQEYDASESDDGDSEKEDAPIPVNVPQIAVLNTAYRLGRHLLICGSSSDIAVISAHLTHDSVDSIVTDPPYGISFMGKKWDIAVPSIAHWEALMPTLKPGGHLISFSGTRTYHRMTVNIEDAGFEIRDQIQWIYGSGFPKSLDISKAIDKAAGEKPNSLYTPQQKNKVFGDGKGKAAGVNRTPGIKLAGQAITNAAKQWSGYGTGLKPANEPAVLARKPLSEDTIAKNVMKHGTGGLNIDGGRIGNEIIQQRQVYGASPATVGISQKSNGIITETQGRFPSNVILSENAAAELDEQSGLAKPKPGRTGRIGGQQGNVYGDYNSEAIGTWPTDPGGGASRFFYIAKSSKSERGEGNNHATVKPIKLMEYLIKLITPEGGTVLEPFAGSGTTILAAEKVGMKCVAFELDPHHCDIIIARYEAMTGNKAEKVI